MAKSGISMPFLKLEQIAERKNRIIQINKELLAMHAKKAELKQEMEKLIEEEWLFSRFASRLLNSGGSHLFRG